MNKFFAICLVLAAGLAVSEAVRCYVCTSEHGGCEGSLDPKYVEDCGYYTDNCMKATARTGGINALTRSCGSGYVTPRSNSTSMVTLGCTQASVLGVTSESCICQGDMCNSAGYVKTSVMVAIGAVAASLVFRY